MKIGKWEASLEGKRIPTPSAGGGFQITSLSTSSKTDLFELAGKGSGFFRERGGSHPRESHSGELSMGKFYFSLEFSSFAEIISENCFPVRENGGGPTPGKISFGTIHYAHLRGSGAKIRSLTYFVLAGPDRDGRHCP